MDYKRSGPDALADAAPGQMQSYSVRNSTRPPLKWKRVLSAFHDGATLNRFEAERALHDHCLHSTVSTIQAKGVTILRKLERVPGYQQIPTEVCRYWIAPDSRQRAAELLGLVPFPSNAASAPRAPYAALAREELTLTP